MTRTEAENPHDLSRPRTGEPLPDWIARLREDQLQRWTEGRPVPVTVHVQVFPELAGHPDALLDLIAHEIQLRREAGERPTATEYTSAFPDLAGELETQFTFDACLEQLQSSADAIRPATPAWPGPSRQPPPVPSRFRIVRRLGAGGFGEVWLADDVKENRRVALKFPRLDPEQPELLARFRREADTAAGLNHPNLCTLHERFWDHFPPFLVLEYIDGRTLTEELAEQPRLPIAAAVEIITAAVSGVWHAHQRGIVHRDLKPDNITIRADRIVKVLDFGLARPSTPAAG